MAARTYKTGFIITVLFGMGVLAGLFLVNFDQRCTSHTDVGTSKISSIKRVVSIAPMATEAIFALNAQDSLVGVGDFCDWPPQAKQLPSVGGDLNPNLEKITALHSNLLLVLGQSENLTQYCRRNHIQIFHVGMTNLQSLYDDLNQLGQILGRSRNAHSLCTKIQNDLDHIRTITRQAPTRPKVFFVLFRRDDTLAGLATVTAGTTHDELITIAGGQNIFADLDQPYCQISKESLVKRQPDIIIEPRNNLDEKTRKKLIDDWRQLPSLPAVQNNRIYFPPADLVLKPGPRVVMIARTLAKCIHPELFHD